MICRIALNIFVLVMLASTALAASEVRLPLDFNPVSIDPQKLSESHEFLMAEDLFEGLTTITASGVVVPGTAEKWETSADGLTWTFHAVRCEVVEWTSRYRFGLRP
jgi:oligopeptide transport system substrate-binding protein